MIKLLNRYQLGKADCVDGIADDHFFTIRLYRNWPTSVTHTFVATCSGVLSQETCLYIQQKVYKYDLYNHDFRNYEVYNNGNVTWSCFT